MFVVEREEKPRRGKGSLEPGNQLGRSELHSGSAVTKGNSASAYTGVKPASALHQRHPRRLCCCRFKPNSRPGYQWRHARRLGLRSLLPLPLVYRGGAEQEQTRWAGQVTFTILQLVVTGPESRLPRRRRQAPGAVTRAAAPAPRRGWDLAGRAAGTAVAPSPGCALFSHQRFLAERLELRQPQAWAAPSLPPPSLPQGSPVSSPSTLPR